MNFRQLSGLLGGLVLFLFIALFLDLEPGRPEVTYTLATAALMAVWWITEVVPLAVTSLLPVVLFPLLGVMDGKDVSSTYFNHVILLFIGGFIVALAMQRWDLHKRIALRILMVTGVSPGRILLGFMLATAFLSMWISNTATSMMMVPILISIINKLEDIIGPAQLKRYSIGLLLGVAYSASIGGIATLVGTPPNLAFSQIFHIMFPEAPGISFSAWFMFGLPVSIVLLAFVWTYLYFLFRPRTEKMTSSSIRDFRQQYRELGPFGYEERAVFILFVILAFLWLTRSEITVGNLVIPGWASLFKHPEYFNDGTVAILVSILLFIIPSRKSKNDRLMDWKSTRDIPWNIVLLFGGGFALASGFMESGLSEWFLHRLNFAASYHPIVVIFVICIMMTFLTELTSNTATTQMLLPILAQLAVSVEVNPLLFMLPATLSASMAFMLPVATPPNAIVFGTGRLRVADMARNGFVLNIMGALLITLATWYLGEWFFGIDPDIFPAWALQNR